MPEDKQRKAKALLLLQQKKELTEGLPHLFGMKHYKWSRAFYESRNSHNLLCAANQIGKSSAQVRKVIHWATEDTLWPSLWRKQPRQFWYLYPTRDVASIEVEKKWIPELLPRGKFKDHPKYGWDIEKKGSNHVFAIHFRSGVSLYFKSYETEVSNLQTGSVDALFTDEELPVDLFDELNLRLAATDGYFHMVFTATLGQEFWKEVIEHRNSQKLKNALKIQVSMYDCLQYEDGSASHWTTEKIERIKASCRSEAEIQRRVYGKFVKEDGLKYPGFTRETSVCKPFEIPKDHLIFAGIDPGGGGNGHPAAITFVACSPDFKKGYVFKGWRGDKEVTTSADVLKKYLDLKEGLTVACAYYDWANKDIYTIASRLGIPLVAADKSHERGEQVFNVLLKSGMLQIFDIPDLRPLMGELESLLLTAKKQSARDDYIDATRYAITPLPWNYSAIGGFVKATGGKKEQFNMNSDRRSIVLGANGYVDPKAFATVDDEIAEWAELYEP